MDRDFLGEVVRIAWISWAVAQSNPKPSWLVPYAELAEPDKEADRQIGESVLKAVFDKLNKERLELMHRPTLTGEDQARFTELRYTVFVLLELIHPRPKSDVRKIEEIEARMAAASGLSFTPHPQE